MGGCASARAPLDAPVGVRDGAAAAPLERIAVLPFVAEDPFGLTRQEREALLTRYTGNAVAELRRRGAQVVAPEEIAAALTAAGEDASALRRLGLHRSLELLFEPAPFEEGVSLEDDRVVFARELAALLRVDALLVGQVIYHTTGRCPANDETIWTDHLLIEGAEVPTGDEPVPCAISHVHAKLLDGRTGLTLWYNRTLREVRAASAAAPTPDPEQNADQTLLLNLTAPEEGLLRLLP